MKILAANMWPAFTFADRRGTYETFVKVCRPRFRTFIESLILYREVHVPTDDFLSLIGLIGVLGPETVNVLLEAEALKFFRFKGAFAYIGNGNGLGYIEIGDGKGNDLPFCAPTDVALRTALSWLPPEVNVSNLDKKVLKATTEVKMSDIVSDVEDATYKEILSSPELRSRFAIRNTNLKRLVGIAADQVRCYGGVESEIFSGARDEIDTVLLLGRANLEMKALALAGCNDLNTATPVGHVLAAYPGRNSAFDSLHQIPDMPDIGELLLTRRVSISEILKLRESRHWQEFTKWFHEKCADDPATVVKEYVRLLKSESIVDQGFLRTVRFFVTTVIGLLNPVAGVAAGAADTYLVGRLREPSAKFFIEQLEQFTPGQTK